MLSMDTILQKARELKEKTEQIEQNLSHLVVEGSSGGGMVKVQCKGSLQFSSLQIEAGIVNSEDLEMLQDLILAACNDALHNAKQLREKEMHKLTGGLSLSGLFS